MNNEPTQIQSVQSPKVEPVTIQAKAPVQEPSSVSQSLTEGFNLLPSMTKEEKVVAKTKSTVNLGSVVSLIVLVLIILGVVGFNIVSKQMLNGKKKELYALENIVNQQSDKIIANDEIVDRAILYSNIKKGAFSHKEIIEFLSGVCQKVGDIQIRSVMISENLEFTFVGYTTTLEKVSKLWYILGIDENIETINLKSVGKSSGSTTFTFEGKLNIKNFSNN